jgi:aspartate/tyrosine/aromatic aminotransferase
VSDSIPGLIETFMADTRPGMINRGVGIHLEEKCASRCWRGVVTRVRWPMHAAQFEDINNRVRSSDA